MPGHESKGAEHGSVGEMTYSAPQYSVPLGFDHLGQFAKKTPPSPGRATEPTPKRVGR